MKLSIVIPYYNVKVYTDELLAVLAPQITDDVEVILIDDGSKEPYTSQYPWCTVYRKENGGVSSARNMGMDKASGEYIAFIDADDIVAPDYVSTILSKTPFDYLDMSWKSLPGGTQYDVRLNSDTDRLSNPSSVTRAFRRAYIGDVRFNENKDAAEDAEFIKAVCKPDAKVAVVTHHLYFYRTYTPNSLTKRYFGGDTETKRIIYHIPHITSDMAALLKEVKIEHEHNEVIIMTNQNDIPELTHYADIKRPGKVRGHELRGEPLSGFIKINTPLYAQIAIYISHTHICGIYTWVKAFCEKMSETYNIIVLHEGMDPQLIVPLMRYADVRRNGQPIRCETLLMMSIQDVIPITVHYKRSIQVVHAIKTDEWTLPADRDEYIPISEAVRRSWNLKAKPILNLVSTTSSGLRLITASRIKSADKGRDRMDELVDKLHFNGIPFTWDCYSDADPHIKGITFRGMTPDIRTEIRAADYLVQLSDAEGFCYSIVEALQEGTAVITTPVEVLSEIGFIDGEHGYTIPFDMDFDVHKLTHVPHFTYAYDNEPSITKWKSVLGESSGIFKSVHVRCIKDYRDMVMDQQIHYGDILTVSEARANEIITAGYGQLVP